MTPPATCRPPARQARREQARKAELQTARDDAATTLLSPAAKGELAGIEREYTALVRDRDARAKREKGRQGLPAALDKVRVAPRAMSARSPPCWAAMPSRRLAHRRRVCLGQTGASGPAAKRHFAVADSLLDHIK